MIRLLEGQSLTHARMIPLEALNIQLKERDSTATMTPADMTGITVNSWVEIEDGPGAGSVWRVRSIRSDILTDTPQVQLEHMIGSLRDNIIFGEITPKIITNNNKATTCTAEQAIRYILSHQDDWVLGAFEYAGVSNAYKFDGDSLYDALETVSNSLRDAWWSYDMSVYPFRLNITRKSAEVGSEMRAGRNLRTITKTIDKSGMYTRFYPIGNNDLHIDGDYLEENSEIYGVISKVETDASITTKAELERFAMERLRDHCEPTVTVDVEGLELADATGEPLDRLQLGAYCRIPLPEYGTTILERIVSLNYPDALSNPESVRITLGNNRTDVTKIIADAMKTGGKSRRAAARRDKQDNAWFEDTNEHVAMCAKGIVGTDAQGNPNWLRLSSIIVDGTGIHQMVQSVQNDVVLANTRIDQNEYAITLEANQRVAGEAVLSGRITVEADRITQEVTDRRNSDETLDGRITVEAGKITQIVSAVGKDGQVTAASICLAINNGGSSATINADKIYLLGQTIANTITADYINSKVGTIPVLNTRSVSVTGYINSTGFIYAPEFVIGTNSSGAQNNKYVSNAITDLKFSKSGGTVTLQKKDFGDTSWVNVDSFSRATALSGTWSGGKITMSANADNVPNLIHEIRGGEASWSGNVATTTIYAYTNTGQLIGTTGRSITVDASGIYTAGYNAGIAAGSPKLNLDWRYGKLTITPDNNGKSMPQTMELSASSTWLQNVCTIEISSTDGEGNTESTGFTTQVTYSAPGVISDLGIYDINNNLWSGEKSLTGEKELWPQYKDNGTWVVGPKLTLSPDLGTKYRLDCTAKTPSYPGSTLYDYTFKLSSRAGSEFSVGTVYDFYRP